MILINEWLPNPVGNDASGEFVELFNGGKAPVNLGGWTLATSDKKLKLSGTIDAEQYLLLKRNDTKLVLKNSDEKLFLYDGGGNLADKSGFLGMAPEGKSFSRSTLNDPGERQTFVWSNPTPGATNEVPLTTNITRDAYPSGALLGNAFGPTEFWSLLLGTAVALTAITIFALKQNENLSKLLFGGDETFRQ